VYTGLHALRARLRIQYPGQCVPDAQAGHQNAKEGPGPTSVGVQDVQSDQESHTSRAQGPVRREKGMRRIVDAWPRPRTLVGALACARYGPQVSGVLARMGRCRDRLLG